MKTPLATTEANLSRDFAIARVLMENTQMLALLVSAEGTILDLNQAMAESLGHPVDQLKGTLLCAHLPAESRARHQAAVQRVIDGRQPYRHDTEYNGKHYDSCLTPCLDEKGNVLGVVVIAWDISDRKHAEQEGNKHFESMADAAPVLIWAADADMKCTYFSKPWLDFTGRTLGAEMGSGWLEMVHPEDRAACLEIHNKSSAARQPFRTKYRLRRHDGEFRWILDNGVPRFNAEGAFAGYIGSAVDITETKQAEEALSASEAKLQEMIDVSPVAMALNDEHDNITFLNRRFVETFGYTQEDIPTVDAWWPLAYPDPVYREQCRREWRAATETAHRTSAALQLEDYRVTCKDGSTRDIRFSLAPLGTSHVVLLYDITERNQMEAQLRQSQKLEAIGHLAGGMAHEFNNILAAMMMNLDLAQLAAADAGASITSNLDEIAALCNRSAELVRQLLAFSRQSLMRIQPMDLAASVSRQGLMLDRLLGEGISVAVSADPALPWVNADKTLVEQVLLNLCLNARDAMRNGGTIRIHLAETNVSVAESAKHPEAHPGRFVSLSVSDTGSGMDDETMKRLFEPFFTTKPVGQGTGLGLATVRGMVQQHRGWVEVESHVRQGSTFRVYLPAVDPPLTAPSVPQQPSLSPGSGTILLVEDELALRNTTRALLVQMGYAVLEACNGENALLVWKSHRDKIDLIFADMLMPGALTGLQLIKQFQQDKPGVKAIITSGHHPGLVDPAKLVEASIAYLPKPSPAATIISTIKECLKIP